jgi:hypothetical protein
MKERAALKERELAASKEPSSDPVESSFKIEGLNYELLCADANLRAAFETTVKQTLLAETGESIPKDRIKLKLTAGSVIVQATFMPTSGVDMNVLSRRLRSSPAFDKKLAAYVSAIDGIQRIATGPIRVVERSTVTNGVRMAHEDEAFAIVTRSQMEDSADTFMQSFRDSTRTQTQWEPVATKFFNKIDRRGSGFVENFQILQLWPVLSRHVDNTNAAVLAAQMLQSTSPMTNFEWMALMKALNSIVGPKRLRRNLRSAEAYYVELIGGSPCMADFVTSAGSPGSPLLLSDGNPKVV